VKTTSENSQTQTRAILVLVCLIIAGMAAVVSLSRWLDSHRPAIDAGAEAEKLYVTGNTVRRLSLGFNGLVADWYWMRSLQYVGKKILNYKEDVQLDNLGQLNLTLLAPLLDTATTVDPQFMEPYQYAAVVLADVDPQQAIHILKKGIAANPLRWRLYQHLGYIYWQQGDFQAASDAYARGSELPGAPPWMAAMKAQMAAKGGSRSTARQIYARMYQETDDPNLREMARRRLLQLQSFGERDVIRLVLEEYTAAEKRCTSSWKDVSGALRKAGLRLDASGAPLDPANIPYRLVKAGCDVDLDVRSEVPYK
jgi:Flp pilus assembly protein TadD